MTPTSTESFVPLTTALPGSSGDRAEFRATVVSQPGNTHKFPTGSAASFKAGLRAGNCEPQVSLQRDGNRVTGIRVQCSCGEVIELACVFEAAPPAPPVSVAPPAVAVPEPATMPQLAAAEPTPGKICKDSGKVLPTPTSKRPKVPEKPGGTSAAKRRSA